MRFLISFLMFAISVAAQAEEAIKRWDVEAGIAKVYPAVYQALEDNRFFVIFEPNIGKNLSSYAQRWGDEYNQNELSAIRSMVFCNPWYANQVSNLDTDMLALCPLHMTLIEKDGKTQIVFVQPTFVADGSKAESILRELETDLYKAVEQGIGALEVKK